MKWAWCCFENVSSSSDSSVPTHLVAKCLNFLLLHFHFPIYCFFEIIWKCWSKFSRLNCCSKHITFNHIEGRRNSYNILMINLSPSTPPSFNWIFEGPCDLGNIVNSCSTTLLAQNPTRLGAHWREESQWSSVYQLFINYSIWFAELNCYPRLLIYCLHNCSANILFHLRLALLMDKPKHVFMHIFHSLGNFSSYNELLLKICTLIISIPNFIFFSDCGLRHNCDDG